MERNLTITQFAKALGKALVAQLNLDAEIFVQKVDKNNGQKLTGLVIRENGSNVAPTLYVDSAYKAWKDGHNYEDIIDQTVELYKSTKPSKSVDVSFYLDYEQVKQRLFAKLVNLKANKAAFNRNNVVYRVVAEDLAEVAIVGFENETMGAGTITVKTDHLEKWGIVEEQLWRDVHENLEKAEWKVQTLTEIISGLGGAAMGDDSMCSMYVCSTPNLMYGAVSMISQSCMEDICEKCSDDEIVILPSSVHECIIIPKKLCEMTMGLAKMVREINASVVSAQEVLSDSIYTYSRITHEFRKVSDKELKTA